MGILLEVLGVLPGTSSGVEPDTILGVPRGFFFKFQVKFIKELLKEFLQKSLVELLWDIETLLRDIWRNSRKTSEENPGGILEVILGRIHEETLLDNTNDIHRWISRDISRINMKKSWKFPQEIPLGIFEETHETRHGEKTRGILGGNRG